MIRVAAVGDIHYGRDCRNRLKAFFDDLGGKADLLMIAGDLTQSGSLEEAKALIDDLKDIPVPVVSVLGNHDFHRGHQLEILDMLRSVRVIPLEGNSTVLQVKDKSVGIMGLKGFGGGFGGACCTEFGEPEMKAFARHAKAQADILRDGLAQLETDYRFVLLHYSPVDETLLGEKREIYPFLGSYLLADAIDASGADAVFHGHAHFGVEKGATPRGIPVRNVAQPVLRHAYHIYTFEHSTLVTQGSSNPRAPQVSL